MTAIDSPADGADEHTAVEGSQLHDVSPPVEDEAASPREP